MGADLLRKYVNSLLIVCYRSVVKHPFLVGMIIVLFSLYRLFPLLFSLLLSVSPVIISTFVLLGTLLSFGHPNIPEIEPQSKSKSKSDQDEIHNRKSETKVTSDTEIIGRDVSFASEETNTPVNLINDDGELQFGEEELIDNEKVVLGSHYTPLHQSEDEYIVLESDDKLWEGSADPLNSDPNLLWKRVEGNNDDDDDDDEGSDSGDSGSDLAESSSPDASMADIIPMLDELHPLLSEEQESREVPHRIDTVSEHSIGSSDSSSESNDGGNENHEDLELEDDEDEEEDDKEMKHVDKEDEILSVIKWTEYDQKNLMNLGTSEMERNKRLENLILRRRARKTMRMQAEKNLIDLESADIPWNIPPISTARNNPFDYDSNDNIPGSAPSVMLQRRNPFDLPYDSSEEKPDLVGDTFQQEFAVAEPKEPFFRRHESFNVGPSIFGASRSERQETRMRPYFVPERSFAEFQRQFSGLSDSKVSSVPDTESVSSDLENKYHIEIEEDEQILEAEQVSESDGRPYFLPEQIVSDETSFPSFQKQLSEVSDSKVSSVNDTESVSSAGDLEKKDLIDLSREPDLITLEDHEHDSEIRECVFEHDGNVDPIQVLEDNEGHVEAETNKIHLNLGDRELHRSVSSLSSSDEVNEQIYNEKGSDEVATSVSETSDYFVNRVNSIETSEIDITSLEVEESQPKEPIYDLSPRSVTRNLSSSSILNDLHKDESFQHTDDHNQPSSSVADVKLNSTDSSPETGDAQNQLPTVLNNEEQLLAGDSISSSLPNKPILDTDASHQLEQILIPLSNSHERFHEGIHQEKVISQSEDADSSFGRSLDKTLAEDPEELQGREGLEQGQVALSNTEPQFTEVVHGETYEHPSEEEEEEATSQLQKQFPLLDTSVKEPAEENPEELQVQIGSNNLDNLPMQEPENNVSLNINSVSSAESDVIEVADIETKAPESPAHASDTRSIENNYAFDNIDDIEEIDEDLLVELDAVGDFSVNDLESTLNEMKEDPHALEHDLETMPTVEEDSYSETFGSIMNDMKEDPHVSEHDHETKHSVDEDCFSKDLSSALNEITQESRGLEHDIDTKFSGDEDSYSKDLGSTLDEMKQDPHASDHDLENKHSVDEGSCSKGLILGEMKQDPHASEHDLETKLSGYEDSFSKDLESTLDEIKQDPHESGHNLETNRSVDEDSFSKDLKSTFTEMKQDPHAQDHDLETNRSIDEDSYSKDLGSTLVEMKDDPHASERDLETNRSVDEDSDSKDLGSTLDEMKQDPDASYNDLKTKLSGDEDSFSKDLESTFNEIRQVPQVSEHCLDTFYSVDGNFYSKHVESTLKEVKQDQQATNQDLETNRSGDKDPHSTDSIETKIKMDAEEIKSQNEKEISNTKVAGASDDDALKLINDASEVVLPQQTEMVNHGTENESSTTNTDKE